MFTITEPTSTARPVTRFDRQLSVPGFGEPAQHRLRAGTVLVAGVGGVGGAAATYLAAAGVGTLELVHPGVLEEPDLNRQTLMHPERVGELRASCAGATLHEHYPDVDIRARPWDLDHPRVRDLVGAADVVIDARHNFPERFLLNRLCVETGTPLVVAAMNATEAFVLTVAPGSPCLRCVFADGDPAWEPLGFPVLGAVAGTAGCLAAMEAVKVLSGFGRPATGRLVHLDLWDTAVRAYRTRRDPDCPDCSGGAERSGGAG